MTHMNLSDPDTGEDLMLPAKWEICDTCNGDGGSSAYLGAFTGDEWAEMDYDWKEQYIKGSFDRNCDDCRGTGKVLFPILELCNARQKEAWELECAYRADRAHEAMLRERGIEY